MNNNSSNETHDIHLASRLYYETNVRVMGKTEGWAEVGYKAEALW